MKAYNYKLCILIFTGILLSAFDSNANWIKRNCLNPAQNILQLSEGRMTSMPYIGGIQKKDSLPDGVTQEWLNSLRDENGGRIMPEEPETDFIQRRVFDGFSSFEYFGVKVSSSGDVNGDGFNDIAIGATYNNAGRLYLFFGGPDMDTEPDVILNGETDSSEFGNFVTLSNVNGDSYCDVIVGANHYNSSKGRVYVFLGGAPMDTIADVVMTGEGTGDLFGILSSAGDVNKDGYNDIIVGADGNSSNTGRAYIYFGGTNMNNVPDVIMTGEGGNYHFGIGVASAGDVNKDGYDDVIVGAHGANLAYIFLGGSNMNNTADVVMNGVSGGFGQVVSTAGDVNGDGFSDVIVGADRYGNSDGRTYIYYGGSAMNSTADVIMTGEGTNSLFGTAASSAGDINKDGYSDVVVVAYEQGIGKVYVYFGSPTMNDTADIIINGATFASVVTGGSDVTGDGNPDFLVGAFRYNSNTGRVYLYDYSVGGNITSDTVRRITGPGLYQGFGMSVSSAGDVNKDGFNDLIVGSTWNDSTGKAYIFYGGLVFDTIPDLIMYGEAGQNSEFGNVVSSAGDVNGDGYSDVIVAGKHYNSNTGRAYIFLGGAAMDNIPDVIVTGTTTGSHLGNGVSSAGDVNRDGYSDVIISETGFESDKGRAFIFYGGAEMDNSPDVTMAGETSGDYFGGHLSAAGDVNGDGYSDVIVGALWYNGGVGRAYVFLGGTPMNGLADVTLTGENGHFGNWVSSAGDVNADGFSDIIVGAYRYGSNDAGKVYLYHGGSSMNNSADLTFNGTGTDALLGNTLACVGDLNKDGYDDIILPENLNGKAYIYFGGSIMDNIPDITKNQDTPLENYSRVSAGGDINGDGHLEYIVGAPWYNGSLGKVYIYDYKTEANIIPDLVMNGETTNNYFGAAVSSAGDVNNDGYEDVIVGAPSYDRAYIFLGGSLLNNTPDIILNGQGGNFGISVSYAGDVNNDNYSDVIVGAHGAGKAYIYFGGSTMGPSADIVLDAGEGGYFGMAVSTAGDVNGDSYSDVIVGAYRFGADVGRTYIFFGGATMNNSADLIMTGEETDDIFGSTVSSAGDVNRDGYSDVIVGAPHELPPNGSDTGKAYIFYGGANMDTIADVKMYGEQVADDFGVVSSAGDVNGDGFSDVIVTSLTYNNIYGSQDGRAYIYFGDSSMNNVADVVLYGEVSSQFGRTPSANDINGDGYSDVIIGAEQYDSKRGKVYIYYGGAQMNNTVDKTMLGELQGDCFGVAVSSAGDVNKDGFPDIIVGAPEKNTFTGRAYIYLASAIGSPANKKFRSKVSGNWNTPLTWEMSTNGGSSWVQATSYPNDLSDEITIRNSHVVRVTKKDSVDYVIVENGGQLSIDSMITFRVNNLKNAGILSVTGTLISKDKIEYNGISPQILVTTNINYTNLTINNPAGVTVSDNFSIPGLLSIVNGDLNLNGKIITLLDTARLLESPGNTVKGDSGSITTTRNIYQPNSLNVAGLGAVITSSENFGLTTIKREHNIQNVNTGTPSIRRNFTISPLNNSALNANLIFKYDTSELDTLIESSLGLYSSNDNGANYTNEGGNVDTSNNQIVLNYLQTFSLLTAARTINAVNTDIELTGNLYAKGKICIRWGSMDTIGVRIKRPEVFANDSIKVNYVIKDMETYVNIIDMILTIPRIQADTTVFLQMPRIVDPGPHSIIVQAIPDELSPLNGFDIRTYCFDVTCDAFSYIQPCDTIDGGAGFESGKGKMAAGFTNLNATEDFPIHAIDQSFLDSGSGNAPYKVAIYADNGSGKPGTALYISPELFTPPGTGSVETRTHVIDPPINIPPNTKFYVGYIQTSATNIKTSFQDEIPVRSNVFFFSDSDTNNVWMDFASDSTKNFRLDISPRTSVSSTMNSSGISLTLYTLLEGFYNEVTDNMISDTVKLVVHSFYPPYKKIDSAEAILESNGRGIFNFTNIIIDSGYYFALHHRNHLETWSQNTARKFDVCGSYYNFTNKITKAFGDNLKFIDGKYMVFSGDVNQDGIVDASDLSQVENDASNSVEGYVPSDLNGDNFIDASDVSIAENNSANSVMAITP